MKKLLLLCFFLAMQISAQNYKQVKVFMDEIGSINSLNSLGLDIDHAYFDKSDKSLWIFVNERELQLLNSAGLRYEILIEDWREHYKNRPRLSAAERNAEIQKSRDLFNVKGFDYGSMGGYLTYQEIQDHLDSMRVKYPHIITEKASIGQSLEGRDIFMVKISDNPEIDENEPEVLYDALTHAREPQGMMTIVYFMYYLLENYGVDDEVTYLVNNRELYFVPVLNPDGYEYNRSTNPNGGGMWRKNRSINSDGSRGVDLNRNFGYQWGYDDSGSSSEPYRETYRGPAPFSEPETEALRQFCNSRNFRNALNYHTYSNLLILPWGYIPEETPDSLIYRQFGMDMTAVNNYTWGISSDIIYAVNGDTDDWMYGEQNEKNKILSMTPEVGSGVDGFWPPESRIFPLAMENVEMNLYLAWAAGGFVGLTGAVFSQDVFNPGDNFTVTFYIKNKGLDSAENLKVSLQSASEYLGTPFNYISIDTLRSQEADTLVNAFGVRISNDAPVGEMQKFVLITSSNGIVMSKDTLGIYVGSPKSVFFDDCQTITNNWIVSGKNSNKWTVTGSDFYSAPSSFTDSKNGNYSPSNDVTLITENEISLKGIDSPRLAFWTKYDIESGWDYAQVLVSSDNGSNWKPMNGLLTKTGGGDFQPVGEPVYDGISNGWQREEIDLSEFAGENIKIKFRLVSDSYIEGDGWYLDDINVFHYTLVSNKDKNLTYSYKLEQNYPNPFNPSTTINYSIKERGLVTIKLYDALGREIRELVSEIKSPGAYTVDFNASGLSTGVYYYQLKVNDYVAGRKMILLK